MASQAVDDYNSLLERDSGLLEESRDFLSRRLNEVRFVFGGRMLSPYLRPHFVTRDEWQRITSACDTVWGAIEKVGRLAPENKLMLDQLGLTPAELELAGIDPGYPE